MFEKIFLNHPRKVQESYSGHMLFAIGFAGRLGLAAGAALVHALIPALCEHTASRIVRELEQKTRPRRPDSQTTHAPAT